MPFLAQGKTNWKFPLIVVILAAIVGGGILWWIANKELPEWEFPSLLSHCNRWYNDIEKAFQEANFCERDQDCKAIALGATYIEFGCYKFVNIVTDEDELLKMVTEYDKECGPAINKCAPIPEAVCVSNKCVAKTQETVRDETADWQTYRNEEYGFEIKYPSEFWVFEKKEGLRKNDEYVAILFGVPEWTAEGLIAVSLYQNEKNLPLISWIEKIEAQYIYEDFQIEEVLINNQKGINLSTEGKIDPLINHYYFAKGKVIYVISKHYSIIKGGEADKIFNQMLSTFRFLD